MLSLKTILLSLVMPLPLSIALMTLGGTWHCFTKRGFGIVAMGVIILFTFSFAPVSNTLLSHLEQQTHPLSALPPNIHTILVLGAGNAPYYHYPPNTHIDSASLSRLIEAIRLYHQNNHARIILSGGRAYGELNNKLVRNTALALGVNKKNLDIRSGSSNTLSEAEHLAPSLLNAPFVLITSAYHMPRAIQIFKAHGLTPIPAPTHYLVKHANQTWTDYLPNAIHLLHSDIAIHEYLGLLWNQFTLVFSLSDTPPK